MKGNKTRKLVNTPRHGIFCEQGAMHLLRMVKAYPNLYFSLIFALSFVLSASIEDKVHVLA